MLDSANHRLLRRLLTAGLVLVSLSLVALWWMGDRAVDSVGADTGTPTCEGTEVTAQKDFDNGVPRPAIPMAKGFACTVMIRVVNGSDREVSLGEIMIPVGGPDAGASFRVTHLGNDTFRGGADEIDAVADLDTPVPPEDEVLVQVRIEFRPSGCASRGGSMTLFPTIEVRDLLTSHDLEVIDFPVLVGTAASSCDT